MPIPVTFRSIKYYARRLIPTAFVKHYGSRRRQRAAQVRRRERDVRIARYGTLDAAALTALLRDAGVRTGGVLLVQTSFNDLFTFAGRPADLLQVLRDLVGPAGTLLMPAYTDERVGTAQAPLDLTTLPTYTGIVNELFRRSPGVLRSMHPRHSLCAEGPLARTLLDGHDECLYADGPNSPLDRLRQRDDGQILTLGLPPAFTSFLHWLEDTSPTGLPLDVHESSPRHYTMRHPDGRISTVSDMQVRPEVAARLDLQRVARALTPPAMRHVQQRGIDIGLYSVQSLAEQLVALRDRGVFHYR
jgi:aminoglycoside N3'-acetyltransferase